MRELGKVKEEVVKARYESVSSLGPRENFLAPEWQMLNQSIPMTFISSLSLRYYNSLYYIFLQNISFRVVEQSGRGNDHRGYFNTGFHEK